MVEILPLSSLLEKHVQGKEIDFFSVDTEGFDLEVLKSNDWKRFRPKLVVLETVEYSRHAFGRKLNDTHDTYMESFGYRKVADTYINTIYADESFVASRGKS